MKKGDHVTRLSRTPKGNAVTLHGVIEIASATRAYVAFEESDYWPEHKSWIKYENLTVTKERSYATAVTSVPPEMSIGVFYVVQMAALSDKMLNYPAAALLAKHLSEADGLDYAIVQQHGVAVTREVKHV